jgi:HYDIN/CFA65/VesB-like, Ig-like domain/Cep192 domain 4
VRRGESECRRGLRARAGGAIAAAVILLVSAAARAPRAWGAAGGAAVAVAGTADSSRLPLFGAVLSSYTQEPFCLQSPWLCTDSPIPYNGQYIGHDEPALLFYSSTPGSGNSADYTITIPTEAPTLPNQSGTGGVWNFELMPAFWFGMAMCDPQSAPEYTHTACTPDSDTNIFDNSSTTASDYIGKHPGTAFMEMQFYPPGWVFCTATQWCAALTIDEYSYDQNTGTSNNSACNNQYGQEPILQALITLDGTTSGPAMLMSAGDDVQLEMHDTAAGFQVVLNDLTQATTGSMTASTANGFYEVNFNPSASTCTTTPYAYHPMYATSTVHTRVPWAAHTYNVSFAGEIGHFELCDAVSTEGGSCTQAGAGEAAIDSDDTSCYDANASSNIQIGGCMGTDVDFDGISYQLSWPGTLTNVTQDTSVHPAPVRFTSPLFNDSTSAGALTNFSQVAFETDLPTFEQCTSNPATCTNPPTGANFYPIFTIGQSGGQCVWQLGGANISGTTNAFGGTSTAEYGSPVQVLYPGVGGAGYAYSDYRSSPISNPCVAATPTATPSATPTPGPTATPTATPKPTSTPSATLTPTSTPAVTGTPTPTAAPSVSPSATPTPTSVATPTPTPAATPQPTVAATLKFHPRKLHFPRRIVLNATGVTSNPKHIVLRNPRNKHQDQTITIDSMTTGTSEFAVSSTDCPTQLAPGTKCNVYVTFTPAAAGARADTLTITTNALDAAIPIPLAGTGMAGKLKLSPAPLAFGKATSGTPTPKTITLTNRYPIPMDITGVSTDDPEFAATNTCAVIAPQSSCPMTVTFTPAGAGPHSATLTVTYDSAGSPASLKLTGTGE